LARALGDPDAALADLAAVVALDPTNAEAYMMRATIQLPTASRSLLQQRLQNW